MLCYRDTGICMCKEANEMIVIKRLQVLCRINRAPYQSKNKKKTLAICYVYIYIYSYYLSKTDSLSCIFQPTFKSNDSSRVVFFFLSVTCFLYDVRFPKSRVTRWRNLDFTQRTVPTMVPLSFYTLLLRRVRRIDCSREQKTLLSQWDSLYVKRSCHLND